MILRTCLLTIVIVSCCPLAKSQDTEVPKTNKVGMSFARIPAGEYLMGRGQTYREIFQLTHIYAGAHKLIAAEVPQHKVRILSFLLQTAEVTQGQWEAVMDSRPWHQRHPFVKEGPDHPAQYVSWNDAIKFCERLGEKDGNTYRLPTEAEWEYACRAGTSTIYSFGNASSELQDYGWTGDNAYSVRESYAHRVARKKPNQWGLFDMHGNVWEWCSDWYQEDYYAESPVVDPQGPSDGTMRVKRGGSWRDGDTTARSSFRYRDEPEFADMNLGFRVVCELGDGNRETP